MTLRIELRKGGLEAVALLVEGPFLPEGALKQATDGLRGLGVSPLPERPDLAAALAALAEEPPPPDGVVVAQGVAPQKGVDAQLLPFVPIRDTPPAEGIDPLAVYGANVVYPETVILQVTPPSPGIPGRSLLGAPLPARDGLPAALTVGEGVAVDEEAGSYHAITYGVALLHRRQVRVANAFALAPDFMEARLTVIPDLRRDESQQLAATIAALAALGVRRGLDREALAGAIRLARGQQAPVTGVVAARGVPPVQGREADYRLAFDLEKKIGKVLAGDRIDFREAEVVRNVRKGEPLADLIPAVTPVPGFRVDGTELPPPMERASGPRPGENTVLSEDGTRVLADADGMAVIQGGQFHVVDEYRIPADVDYRSGNIRASGAVFVRGSVLPGFAVAAGKNAEILGDVEEAVVEAVGAVEVRGGVTNGSRIVAGASIRAKHVLSSRLEAGTDVEVKLSITSSQVYARGKVSVLGSQGALVGGEVNAALGVEARTIGSPSSKTHVAVGVDLRVVREIQEIDKERATIPEEMRYAQAALGKDFLRDPRAALAAIPASLRKPKLDLLQKLKTLHERDATLTARRDELVQLNLEQRNARIAVQGEIHAGTILTVGLSRLVIPETLRRVEFYYDPEKNQVAWRRL